MRVHVSNRRCAKVQQKAPSNMRQEVLGSVDDWEVAEGVAG
jgi:hypothetical protein